MDWAFAYSLEIRGHNGNTTQIDHKFRDRESNVQRTIFVAHVQRRARRREWSDKRSSTKQAAMYRCDLPRKRIASSSCINTHRFLPRQALRQENGLSWEYSRNSSVRCAMWVTSVRAVPFHKPCLRECLVWAVGHLFCGPLSHRAVTRRNQRRSQGPSINYVTRSTLSEYVTLRHGPFLPV